MKQTKLKFVLEMTPYEFKTIGYILENGLPLVDQHLEDYTRERYNQIKEIVDKFWTAKEVEYV